MKKRGCCNKCRLLDNGQCKEGHEPQQGFNSSVYQCKHRKLYAKDKKKEDTKKQKDLIKLLDIVFGDYIRYRDKGVCITSGAVFDPTDRTHYHPGHYISRGKMNTRFDEQNVYGQSAGDNLKQNFEGNGLMLEKILSKGKLTMKQVESLRERSKIIKKFTSSELEEMIAEYKQKLDNLRKN